jgi:predicted acetylornithine/succinylornithine family transaminase
MTNDEAIRLTDRYMAQTYTRYPIALVRGEGLRVWDVNGCEYLDFVSGLAVNGLGHSHPKLVKAVQQQMATLVHVSNLFHIPPQAELAQLLCEHSFADRAFFCNSGAEANEAAIKLARKYGHDWLGGRYEIITALNSFHGRTLATLTATGQEKFQRGFQPLPVGFRYVPYDDAEAVEQAISEKTVAVMVEPIQGEGGVIVPHSDYLSKLREICDRREILLILDEVQVGMGRTGRLFAYEHEGILPDVLTLAKSLAGGLPMGAMLARERVAQCFSPGTHASTFGGNPLVSIAALTTLKALLEDGILDHCREMGGELLGGLGNLKKTHPVIVDVRGKGLFLGVETSVEVGPVIKACMDRGLLVSPAGPRVLRLLPALTVLRADIERALGILDEALGSLASAPS